MNNCVAHHDFQSVFLSRNPVLLATQSILEVQVFDSVLQKYMPIQTRQIYRIVTNSYLRHGGVCEHLMIIAEIVLMVLCLVFCYAIMRRIWM